MHSSKHLNRAITFCIATRPAEGNEVTVALDRKSITARQMDDRHQFVSNSQ
jgi:hypothetical protein